MCQYPLDDPERLPKIEYEMRRNIELAQREGWKIVPRNTFIDIKKYCCALGSAKVNDNSLSSFYIDIAKKKYGMTEDEAVSFIYGFGAYHEFASPSEFYKMGERLRTHYIGVEKSITLG